MALRELQDYKGGELNIVAIASQKLRDAGIPGVKYLDKGSREFFDAGSRPTTTEATRNLVLFDDKLVDIVAKNDVPVMREVADRITAANPASKREAQMAASEAIEDIGNRDNNARLQTDLDEGKKFYTLDETFDLGAKPEPKGGDIIGQVPWVNGKGEATTISGRQVANVGKRETELVDLMRECK